MALRVQQRIAAGKALADRPDHQRGEGALADTGAKAALGELSDVTRRSRALA
jgi:hypothetical protein